MKNPSEEALGRTRRRWEDNMETDFKNNRM
jgi:hypothetical protein